MDVRKIVPMLVVLALALGVGGLVLLVRSGDDDNREQRASSSSSTTTSTSVAPTPTTTPGVPPGSPPATTSPPPGTVVVLPTLPPVTTQPAPPDTAAPDTAAPDTAGPTTPEPTTTPEPVPTTEPATTTTSDDDDDADPDPDTIVYSPDGAPKRKGDLLVPDEHGTTALVLVHGGGGTSGNRRQLRGWSDGYADAGYVTLSIDYFLFKDTTPPPVFPIPERDVKAAVQYLRQNSADLEIDPERILVQGFSSGAALGSVAYVNGDDPAFAGEGLYDDGTSDVVNGFIGFYGAYEGNRADPDQYCGGPSDSLDPEVQACYELSDAVALAAEASGPALLFHGDADTTLPLAGTNTFAAALTEAGQTADVVVVEGGDHNFDRTRRALTPEGEVALERVVTWLGERFPEPT